MLVQVALQLTDGGLAGVIGQGMSAKLRARLLRVHIQGILIVIALVPTELF